jgi:hypothetical protein
MLSSNFLSAIFVFAINPRPQFVELQTANRKVPKNAVLIIFADLPNFSEQSHHGLFSDAGHPNGRPNRATLDKAIDDTNAGLAIQSVHAANILKPL